MTEHELRTEGPVRYPGGKDGWFRTYCICNPDRLWWGATEAQSRKPGREHKRAKENVVEIEAKRLARDYREMVTWWLDSPSMHSKRPDLVTKLRKGEEVTLSYEDLYWITATVRVNSTPR